MPIYDYVCGACRHRFEVLHGINEAGPSQCPLCEGPVSRAFAPPTIHFKGSGWARMDRRVSSSPRKKATPGDTSANPVAGAASGDTVPAPSGATDDRPTS
jgi:putative FmdB family regulatory protein